FDRLNGSSLLRRLVELGFIPVLRVVRGFYVQAISGPRADGQQRIRPYSRRHRAPSSLWTWPEPPNAEGRNVASAGIGGIRSCGGRVQDAVRRKLRAACECCGHCRGLVPLANVARGLDQRERMLGCGIELDP